VVVRYFTWLAPARDTFPARRQHSALPLGILFENNHIVNALRLPGLFFTPILSFPLFCLEYNIFFAFTGLRHLISKKGLVALGRYLDRSFAAFVKDKKWDFIERTSRVAHEWPNKGDEQPHK
jgi:hypothetical protein